MDTRPALTAHRLTFDWLLIQFWDYFSWETHMWLSSVAPLHKYRKVVSKEDKQWRLWLHSIYKVTTDQMRSAVAWSLHSDYTDPWPPDLSQETRSTGRSPGRWSSTQLSPEKRKSPHTGLLLLKTFKHLETKLYGSETWMGRNSPSGGEKCSVVWKCFFFFSGPWKF